MGLYLKEQVNFSLLTAGHVGAKLVAVQKFPEFRKFLISAGLWTHALDLGKLESFVDTVALNGADYLTE